MSDLISRQAAIEELERGVWGKDYDKALAKAMLESLPSVQQEQQWIPVSEGFPKVGQTVICQCRADILKLLKLDRNGDWYQDAEHVYMKGFVIAWMPLPKPYKEERG